MIFTHSPTPIITTIFGLPIRWYSLAYIIGFIFSYYYSMYLIKRLNIKNISIKDIEDFFIYGVLGVILGGRIGYVLFYNLQYHLQNPLSIFAVWNGGMSFHGGTIGFIIAIFIFTYKRKINTFSLSDIVVCSIPFGIFLGRIANFLNGELVGRPTGLSNYGMIFTNIDNQLRHPSQLYEATLEGFTLFIIMQVSLYIFIKHNKKTKNKIWKSGFLSGVFLFFYAVFRIILENFREPDAQIGFLTSSGLTMGQLLSFPVICFAGYLFYVSIFKKEKIN